MGLEPFRREDVLVGELQDFIAELIKGNHEVALGILPEEVDYGLQENPICEVTYERLACLVNDEALMRELMGMIQVWVRFGFGLGSMSTKLGVTGKELSVHLMGYTLSAMLGRVQVIERIEYPDFIRDALCENPMFLAQVMIAFHELPHPQLVRGLCRVLLALGYRLGEMSHTVAEKEERKL